MFKFFYLANQKSRGVNIDGVPLGQTVTRDTGSSVEIRPTEQDRMLNPRNLQKAMIERFREYNGGELPRFRLVPPSAA